MKLYTWGPAPNPRRVRMFAAEKGLELAIEDVGDRAVLEPVRRWHAQVSARPSAKG